jgi:hypothetical protein
MKRMDVFFIETKAKPTFVTQKKDKKRKEKQEVIIRIGSKEGNCRERSRNRLADNYDEPPVFSYLHQYRSKRSSSNTI